MTHQYGNSPGSPGPQGRADASGDGELRDKAQQVGEQAKLQARSQIDEQKQGAADRLDRLASSVRAAASQLEQQDDPQLSHYVSSVAGSMGELAESLRTRNVDELMRDVRGMARRNPALFVAGSIAVGFGLARFARASSQRSEPQRADGARATGSGLGADEDAMGAYALTNGSSGGYRGSLSTGSGALGASAGGSAATAAGLSAGTTSAARPGLSAAAPPSGTDSGLSAGGASAPLRTPPNRGGKQP